MGYAIYSLRAIPAGTVCARAPSIQPCRHRPTPLSPSDDTLADPPPGLPDAGGVFSATFSGSTHLEVRGQVWLLGGYY